MVPAALAPPVAGAPRRLPDGNLYLHLTPAPRPRDGSVAERTRAISRKTEAGGPSRRRPKPAVASCHGEGTAAACRPRGRHASRPRVAMPDHIPTCRTTRPCSPPRLERRSFTFAPALPRRESLHLRTGDAQVKHLVRQAEPPPQSHAPCRRTLARKLRNRLDPECVATRTERFWTHEFREISAAFRRICSGMPGTLRLGAFPP
jgi:hypothetical protein